MRHPYLRSLCEGLRAWFPTDSMACAVLGTAICVGACYVAISPRNAGVDLDAAYADRMRTLITDYRDRTLEFETAVDEGRYQTAYDWVERIVAAEGRIQVEEGRMAVRVGAETPFNIKPSFRRKLLLEAIEVSMDGSDPEALGD